MKWLDAPTNSIPYKINLHNAKASRLQMKRIEYYNNINDLNYTPIHINSLIMILNQLVALKQTKMMICRRISALHLLPPQRDEPLQFIWPNN